MLFMYGVDWLLRWTVDTIARHTDNVREWQNEEVWEGDVRSSKKDLWKLGSRVESQDIGRDRMFCVRSEIASQL